MEPELVIPSPVQQVTERNHPISHRESRSARQFSNISNIDTNLRDPERAFNRYEELMGTINRLQIGASFTHETRDYNYTIRRTYDGFLTLRMPKRQSDTYVNLNVTDREHLNNSVSCWVQEEISQELRGNSEDEIQ
jgi:hypothetical protein